MKLRRLSSAISDAKRAFNTALRDRVRPGQVVHVRWGDNETEAVVRHVYNDQVEVESVHGKVYQVDAHRLVEFGTL